MKRSRFWIGTLFIATLLAMITFNACEDNAWPYQVYHIDTTKCTQCHKCYRRCGYGAISITEGKVKIDPKKCVGCGECYLVCPSNAIYDGMTGATQSNGEGDDD
jgi:MinD superfamily P-loop ATPase